MSCSSSQQKNQLQPANSQSQSNGSSQQQQMLSQQNVIGATKRRSKKVVTGDHHPSKHDQLARPCEVQPSNEPVAHNNPLGSVRDQRLNKRDSHQQHCASTKRLHTDGDQVTAINQTRVLSLPGSCRAQATQQSQIYLTKANGAARLEDSTTTVKKVGAESKKLVSSLQSARMRHLQNPPHSFITSNERLAENDRQDAESQRSKKRATNQRITGFAKAVVKRVDTSQQISSARNSNIRESLTDAITPAHLPGKGLQSLSSRQLLYDVHETTSGGAAVNHPTSQSSRYRSEQVSLGRERNSAKDVANYHSASSGGEEASFQQHVSHQGRLLFKRQEKNAGKPSQAFQQISQRNAQNPGTVFNRGVASAHPADPSSMTMNLEESKTTALSFSKDPGNGRQRQLNTQKVYLGDNKRETALRSSQNYQQLQQHSSQGGDPQQNFTVMLSSPRSDEQRFRGVPQTFEKAAGAAQIAYAFERETRTRQGFKSVQGQLAKPATSSSHQSRSLRRIPTDEGGQLSQVESAGISPRVTVASAGNFAKELQKKQQQRLSRKLIDRMASQQALSNEKAINIQDEECSSINQQQLERDGASRLMPTRSSIPVLSTKHFLEGTSVAERESSLRKVPSQNKIAQSHNSSNNQLLQPHQAYEYEQSYDRQNPSMKGLIRADGNESGALHQHSSSVLPSHRHRHLLSSVNHQPPASTEKPTNFQIGSSNKEQESTNQTTVYNSAVVIPIQGGFFRETAQYSARYAANPSSANFRYQNQQQHQRSRQVVSHQFQAQAQQQTPEEQSSMQNLSHNVQVKKVQMKNQQFKFQFRRKTQQDSNYKLKNGRIHKSITTIDDSYQGLEDKPQVSSMPVSTTNQENLQKGHKRIKSDVSVQVVSAMQQQNFNRPSEKSNGKSTPDIMYENIGVQHQREIGSVGLPHKKKNMRSHVHKILSSESPQSNRFNGHQKNSKKYRVVNNQVQQQLPSSNASDGSDFNKMIYNVKSKSRLQSVAVQPSSFSKRLSDHNEKVITSSQNSGGNISGLTLANAQKPPNTPLKLSMQSMQPQSETTANHIAGDEQTTQKVPRRNTTVYENMKTKKRRDEQQQLAMGTESQKGDTTERYKQTQKRTQRRAGYGGFQQQNSTGGKTTSQDGSGSDFQPHQSLPSIQSSSQPKSRSKVSRNMYMKSNEQSSKSPSMVQTNPVGAAARVTCYKEQNNMKNTADTNPYIIRTTGGQSISNNVNSVGPSQLYNDGHVNDMMNDTKTMEQTFNTNLQSFSVYKATYNEDGTSSQPGSANIINETGSKNFTGAKCHSLQSAHNILATGPHSTDQFYSIEQKSAGLSKTSSLGHFLVYQNQVTGQSGQPKQIKIFANQHSAAEIERLQQQISQRELAYSNLKDQFEQLRQQVKKNKRNSSQECVPMMNFDENKIFDTEQVHSGQAGVKMEYNELESVDEVSPLNSERKQEYAPQHQTVMPSQKRYLRSSLNELNLITQRSNSEAHLHVNSSSLKPINETDGQESPTKESKSALRTPAQQPQSKLKRPTKFTNPHKEKIASLGHKSSMDSVQNNNLTKDKSAPHIVQLLKKKTSQCQQMSLNSKVDLAFSGRKKRSLGQNMIDSRTSRKAIQAQSNESSKMIISAPQEVSHVSAKVRASRINQQKAPSKQNQKANTASVVVVSHIQSSASLEKINKPQKEQRNHDTSKYINKIQKQNKNPSTIIGAPQKSNIQSSVSSAAVIPPQQQRTSKSKTTPTVVVQKSQIAANQRSIETLAAIQQTNKLAIQNLKQVINNSTGKKLGTKKRTNNQQQQQQPLPENNKNSSYNSISKNTQNYKTELAVVVTADLAVMAEQIDKEEEEQNGPQQLLAPAATELAIAAQASFGGGNMPAPHRVEEHRFKCAASSAQQDAAERIDTEPPVQETLNRQDSMCKDETPSNEQSQNSSSHPQPALNSGGQFKATGSAFGTNATAAAAGPVQNKLAGLRQMVQAQQQNQHHQSQQQLMSMQQEPSAPTQLVNCFGLAAFPEQRSSTTNLVQSQLENQSCSTSAIFPRHSDQSQSSAAFGVQKQSTTNNFQENNSSSNGLAVQTLQISKGGFTNEDSQQSRCETPIHPNQVVDGIKFMDVQDPTHKPSDLFDKCGESSIDEYADISAPVAPRAGTPMMPLNSTGKEFFTKKSSGPHRQQPQVAAASSSQQIEQITTEQQAAVQIQKQSIQILKQLQKKKQQQGIAVVQQRKVQPAKVVISQNNPFFIKSNNKQNQSNSTTANKNNLSGTESNATNFQKTKSNADLYVVNQFGQITEESRQSPNNDYSNQPQQQMQQQHGQILQYQESKNINSRNVKPVVENSGSGQQNKQISLSSKFSKGGAPHETSIVSHELFYSPIHAGQRGDTENSLEQAQQDQAAVEILPQYSRPRQAQGSDSRRRSDVNGQGWQRYVEESSLQVSKIEPANRDDILDDSLLFALQGDNKQTHHFDNDEADANVEATDYHFFAQQMALQPQIILTHPASDEELEQQDDINYQERSNLVDIIPSTNKKNPVGDGLFIVQEMSNPCNEMAALDNKLKASPGLKKQQLDHTPMLKIEASQAACAEPVSPFNVEEVGAFSLTDKKEILLTERAQKQLPTFCGNSNAMLTSKGSALGGGSALGPRGAAGGVAINSGSKFTLTDMMVQSNANLTYSEESSPQKSEFVSLSDWTKHTQVVQSQRKE